MSIVLLSLAVASVQVLGLIYTTQHRASSYTLVAGSSGAPVPLPHRRAVRADGLAPRPDDRPSRPSPTASGMALGSVRLPEPPATLVVAFASSAMSAYAVNWLIHARQVPSLRPYFLVTLDEQMQAECERLGEPAVPALLLHKDPRLTLGRRAGYLRNDSGGFKLLGKAKALFTQRLLALGYSVLLSDVDSVWLSDPFPFLGGARAPGLADADVLVTNDYADARRDTDITTVFNTGALLLRAGARAQRFVAEWALRTEVTGLIGNDQTEFNRLMVSQYRDGDTSCTVPACLLPRGASIPASETFVPGADGRHSCAEPLGGGAAGASTPCAWRAAPTALDRHSNLTAVNVSAALESLSAFHAANLRLGRRPAGGDAARVAHWMWGGRIRVGLLPMAQFLQGHTFFVQHLHEQLRSVPVHVHATYTLSGDYGKRFRLRSAGLWQAEEASYYTRGDFLHVVGLREALLALLRRQSFPEGVWRCAPGEAHAMRFFDGVRAEEVPFAAGGPGGVRADRLCYHPGRFVPSPSAGDELDYAAAPDPATPHVRLQHLTRLVLRNAFALASATRRRLVLPTVWCMCDRYWWHLKDCRMPGAEALTMPFTCPLDMSFNVDDWQTLPPARVQFVEAAFLRNPRTHAAIRAPGAALTLRVARDGAPAGGDDLPDGAEPLDAEGGPDAAAAPPLTVPSGSFVDELAEALAGSAEAGRARVLRVSASSLLRLSPCGFRAEGARRSFEADVLRKAFGGQHSYCGIERNPNVGRVLERARRGGMADEEALRLFRNCTGNPANAFNRPKVDLGPDAVGFATAGCAGGSRSPAAAALDAVLR